MTVVYKSLHDEGECLEKCDGNSRGIKTTSGRKRMDRERRKGSRHFMELGVEEWWDLGKDVEMGMQRVLFQEEKKSMCKCVTMERCVQ